LTELEYDFDKPSELNPRDEIKILLINFLLFKVLYLLVNLIKIIFYLKDVKKKYKSVIL